MKPWRRRNVLMSPAERYHAACSKHAKKDSCFVEFTAIFWNVHCSKLKKRWEPPGLFRRHTTILTFPLLASLFLFLQTRGGEHLGLTPHHQDLEKQDTRQLPSAGMGDVTIFSRNFWNWSACILGVNFLRLEKNLFLTSSRLTQTRPQTWASSLISQIYFLRLGVDFSADRLDAPSEFTHNRRLRFDRTNLEITCRD